MKRVLLCLTFWLGLGMAWTLADGPDDQYVRIYSMIQDADARNESGEPRAAYEKYVAAQTALKSLQLTYPDWHPTVVKYRLDYIGARLAKLGVVAPPAETAPAAAPAPGTPAAAAAPAAAPAPAAVPSPAAVAVERAAPSENKDAQIQQLTRDLQQVTAQRNELQTRLHEALSAQPAAIDARELAREQVKNLQLQKELDLLRVCLQQADAKAAAAIRPEQMQSVQQSLDDARNQLAGQQQLLAALQQEKEVLQSRLQSAEARAAAPPGPSASAAQEQAIASLRQENELLKSRLASAETRPAAAAPPATAAPAAAAASTQIALLEAENEYLKKEIQSLRAGPAVPIPPAPSAPSATVSGQTRVVTAPADSQELKRLRDERDDLRKQLDRAQRDLARSSARKGSAEWQQMTRELAALQSKVSALEARKVPYTDQELALLRQLNATIATPVSSAPETNAVTRRSTRDLPVGSGPLMADALRAFRAGRFQEAEDRFQQILRMDENNPFVLGNLATIQIQLEKLAEAQTHLQKALQIDPNDPFNLTQWGHLKFLQENYDEALDALSRSATLDPENSMTQNYLGIVLASKGQREAAETAFRKSVQISPNNADAHANLAYIYATQKPPFVALARYHYDKAISLGKPANPDIERILKGAPSTAP
ncbi:MAG TPA: tetratricopeptide repeat protein [Candidatus Paceibacterota bacterium]|nr:tetratricopeptide repeat protein [Verrucomicrobiota bacterium]HRZ46342.1 tetratricopeptide repeat protein [Candidatus Paceibacterota bacterium]HRZ91813.1 tetratricopeptide repeat protein [Candidatus Paceibacterota bacterium]